jgi:hypothetical protein
MTRSEVPSPRALSTPRTRALVPRVGARPLAPTIRSTEMLLLNEELARARMREREAAAAEARLAYRVLAVRRWQRRAERAARLARLAAASL